MIVSGLTPPIESGSKGFLEETNDCYISLSYALAIASFIRPRDQRLQKPVIVFSLSTITEYLVMSIGGPIERSPDDRQDVHVNAFRKMKEKWVKNSN